jgi:hypothetical protein
MARNQTDEKVTTGEAMVEFRSTRRRELCSRRISCGTRIGSARYGNAQAIIRCGEPVQLQLSGFLACNDAEQPVWQSHERLKRCAMLE